MNFLKDVAPGLTIRQIRFSDILAQTLLIWDLPTTRSNLQQLSMAMEKTFGSKSLAHAAKFHLANEDADVTVFDGIRGRQQVKMIRTYPSSLIVYVSATLKLRYQRLNKRSEKLKETGLSYEQFMNEEKVKTETGIPKLGKYADLKITNNGTLEEFRKKVAEFYNQALK